MPKLTAFVSSTMKDFGPVRRDLREWLESRGFEVHGSEDARFPVDPAVHSHDACLRTIEGSHLFILLVGWRYGGLYQRTRQSIVWREYDCARQLGVPVIGVVLKDVNEESMRLTDSRRRLVVAAAKLDPGVHRFINALRHQPFDNWLHLDWDGSFTQLRQIVDSRVNALFVRYQRPHRQLEGQAHRLEPYVRARRELDSFAERLTTTAPGDMRARLDRFFSLMVEYRAPLFEFATGDRYNFVLYRKSGGLLEVWARRAHPDIPRHDRPWRVGEGHIGLCAEQRDLIVASDVRHTASWRKLYDSDELNYVSIVCHPILSRRSAGELTGVFTITSSRTDHFRDAQQLEVLTARSIASIVSMTGAMDG